MLNKVLFFVSGAILFMKCWEFIAWDKYFGHTWADLITMPRQVVLLLIGKGTHSNRCGWWATRESFGQGVREDSAPHGGIFNLETM